MIRGRRRLVTVLLPFLLVGCVSVAPPAGDTPPASTGAAATPAPPDAPDTPWEAELEDVSVDGERSVESALRLFAMAYGPLPGVDGVPESTGRIEGTLARRAVL